MNAINITTTRPDSLHQLAIGIEEGIAHPELASFNKEQLELLKIDSKPKSTAVVGTPSGSLIAIGIAKREKLKDFGASAVRASANEKPLVIDLRGFSEGEVAEVALGALIGGKTPSQYKKKNDAPGNISLLVDAKVSPDLTEVVAIAESVRDVRSLINTPANDLWPEKLADIVKDQFKGSSVKVKIWDEDQLAKERCGGILAVGKGSARPPRLVIMKYRGGGKHLGLVGKGITFDTGGLSLKPADGMVGMKYDMAGAATVFGAVAAIAKLGLKVDVIRPRVRETSSPCAMARPWRLSTPTLKADWFLVMGLMF